MTFYCYCDLDFDLDLMVLMYKHDLNILTKYEVSKSRLSKVRARMGQTHRPTDGDMRSNILAAAFVGGTNKQEESMKQMQQTTKKYMINLLYRKLCSEISKSQQYTRYKCVAVTF